MIPVNKVLPTIPRTDDFREQERWKRMAAKLANDTADNLAASEYLTYATTAVGITISTDVLKVTAPCTITLPSAAIATGKIYRVDNSHSGDTSVVPTGSETIEGEPSQTLSDNCCMDVYSDGANWRIL